MTTLILIYRSYGKTTDDTVYDFERRLRSEHVPAVGHEIGLGGDWTATVTQRVWSDDMSSVTLWMRDRTMRQTSSSRRVTQHLTEHGWSLTGQA